MASSRDRIAGLLKYYHRYAFERVGQCRWDSDNDSEMDQLADAIAELVDEAVRAHEANAPHLYPDGSSYLD